MQTPVSSIREITTAFAKSSSSSLNVVTDLALSTPPVAYFLALLAAGIGVPLSEDVICIVVGTALTKCDRMLRWKLIWYLYAGVVISDAITFWVGRGLRVGVLEPVRKILNLGKSEDKSETDSTLEVSTDVPRKRKRDKLKEKIEQAGDYIGFVVRLSVGMRGPMMMLTGFTNEVPFSKYFGGTLVGAAVSLPIQLAIGYSMSRSLTIKLPSLKVLCGGGVGLVLLSILIRNISFMIANNEEELP